MLVEAPERRNDFVNGLQVADGAEQADDGVVLFVKVEAGHITDRVLPAWIFLLRDSYEILVQVEAVYAEVPAQILVMLGSSAADV